MGGGNSSSLILGYHHIPDTKTDVDIIKERKKENYESVFPHEELQIFMTKYYQIESSK